MDFVSRAPVRFVEPAFLGIVHPDVYKLGSPKDPCTQTVYALVLILYRDYKLLSGQSMYYMSTWTLRDPPRYASGSLADPTVPLQHSAHAAAQMQRCRSTLRFAVS